jgi:hypothetical protein
VLIQHIYRYFAYLETVSCRGGKGLVEKTEGNRQFARPRRRWENNIKLDLREIAYEGVGGLKWDLVAGSCEHGNEPSGSIKGE